MTTKYGHQSSWQYAMEDTPEVPTSSVAFRLPGFTTGETPIEPKFNLHEFRALKQPSDTDMRAVDHIQPFKNEYGWSLTYVPLKRMGDTFPKYDFRHFHNMALNATSSTVTNGAWTYGTSITTNINTFTVFKEIDNIQYQVNGCRIGRLTGRCSVDNPVEIQCDGQGSAASFANLAHTDASSLRDGTPFMWGDVTVYIDGSLATFCTAYEYTVNNNAEASHVLGDLDPKAYRPKGRLIEGSITREFQDSGQYAAAKAGTAKSITISMSDPTGNALIGFRNCKYEEHPIPGAMDGLLTHVLKFRAETMFSR